MSSDLYWRPVPDLPTDHELPSRLKYILARKLWDHDGSLNSGPTELGMPFLGYLYGLADADVEGARELAAAIEKHGWVEVWIR